METGASVEATDKARPSGQLFLFLLFFSLLVGWVVVSWREHQIFLAVARWLCMIGLMLFFLALVGREVNHRVDGALIDARNKLSLSRLQILLWTILTLSAYLTIVLPRTLPNGLDAVTSAIVNECQTNVKNSGSGANPDEACIREPLNISFPPELILAMGISAASFAGSSLVQSSKKSKTVNIEARDAKVDAARRQRAITDEARAQKLAELNRLAQSAADLKTELEAAQKQFNEAAVDAKPDAQIKLNAAQARYDAADKARQKAANEWQLAEDAFTKADQEFAKIEADTEKARVESDGLLHKNASTADARWADLFRGEEIGDYQLIDMSKVQMFFFTLVIVFAYGVAVASLLQDTTALRHPLIVTLPSFSSSLNTLLGISHGAYLSVKTVDHTKTGN